MPRPSGATREPSQRYLSRHSEKSVQQNGDVDSDMGMVFAARTGPQGAPCIFGSIKQSRTAAYAPDKPYWSQGRLRPAIWIGRQTSSRQINMSRVAPEPKMTSISAMLVNCSGTGGTCVAEYSVFCTAQAGVHKSQKEHPGPFMQSAMDNMQNTKRRHC